MRRSCILAVVVTLFHGLNCDSAEHHPHPVQPAPPQSGLRAHHPLAPVHPRTLALPPTVGIQAPPPRPLLVPAPVQAAAQARHQHVQPVRGRQPHYPLKALGLRLPAAGLLDSRRNPLKHRDSKRRSQHAVQDNKYIGTHHHVGKSGKKKFNKGSKLAQTKAEQIPGYQKFELHEVIRKREGLQIFENGRKPDVIHYVESPVAPEKADKLIVVASEKTEKADKLSAVASEQQAEKIDERTADVSIPAVVADS